MSIPLWPDWTVTDTARVWRDAQTQYPVDAVRHFFKYRRPKGDPMPFRAGDRVTVTEDVTVDVGDYAVRFPAGLVLVVRAARPDQVQVVDVDTCDEVWIPQRLVRATT